MTVQHKVQISQPIQGLPAQDIPSGSFATIASINHQKTTTFNVGQVIFIIRHGSSITLYNLETGTHSRDPFNFTLEPITTPITITPLLQFSLH